MLLENTIFEWVQYVTLLIIVLAVYFTLKRTMLNKQWWMDLPMILLFAHGIVYYIALFAVRNFNLAIDESSVFTIWSIFLRFHGYASLLIMAITNYIKENKK